MIKKMLKTILQISLIILITSLGNYIQQLLNVPIAGSIIGLILFYILLKVGIIKESWIESGANLLLTTMVFFFLPSIVGVENIINQININFIVFFILVSIGTLSVAYASGYIAEKLFIYKGRKAGSKDAVH